jgi:hypothetical protein
MTRFDKAFNSRVFSNYSRLSQYNQYDGMVENKSGIYQTLRLDKKALMIALVIKIFLRNKAF